MVDYCHVRSNEYWVLDIEYFKYSILNTQYSIFNFVPHPCQLKIIALFYPIHHLSTPSKKDYREKNLHYPLFTFCITFQ